LKIGRAPEPVPSLPTSAIHTVASKKLRWIEVDPVKNITSVRWQYYIGIKVKYPVFQAQVG
jgi:hypothetical protein